MGFHGRLSLFFPICRSVAGAEHIDTGVSQWEYPTLYVHAEYDLFTD